MIVNFKYEFFKSKNDRGIEGTCNSILFPASNRDCLGKDNYEVNAVPTERIRYPSNNQLYTEQSPLEDKLRIITKHIIDTQIPLSKSQMTRLFYAYQGLPEPKSGQVYNIEKELLSYQHF